MKKFINTYRTTLFFLLLFFIIGIGLLTIDFNFIKEGKHSDFLENLLVEAHGVLGDLLIFGFLLSIYDVVKNKKDKIERYKEELHDYRGWREKEALIRITGILGRLDKIGYNNKDYSALYLIGRRFVETDLSNCSFHLADLYNTYFKHCNLKNCDFSGADLRYGRLDYCDLEKTSFLFAKLDWMAFCLPDIDDEIFTHKNGETIGDRYTIIPLVLFHYVLMYFDDNGYIEELDQESFIIKNHKKSILRGTSFVDDGWKICIEKEVYETKIKPVIEIINI